MPSRQRCHASRDQEAANHIDKALVKGTWHLHVLKHGSASKAPSLKDLGIPFTPLGVELQSDSVEEPQPESDPFHYSPVSIFLSFEADDAQQGATYDAVMHEGRYERKTGRVGSKRVEDVSHIQCHRCSSSNFDQNTSFHRLLLPLI